MKHYSEADLLDTYYTPAGESLQVMMHLADCAECAARYERLDRKMRSLGACGHEAAPTLWSRGKALLRKLVPRRT